MILGERIGSGMRSVEVQDFLLSSLGYFAELFEKDGILVGVLGDRMIALVGSRSLLARGFLGVMGDGTGELH